MITENPKRILEERDGEISFYRRAHLYAMKQGWIRIARMFQRLEGNGTGEWEKMYARNVFGVETDNWETIRTGKNTPFRAGEIHVRKDYRKIYMRSRNEIQCIFLVKRRDLIGLEARSRKGRTPKKERRKTHLEIMDESGKVIGKIYPRKEQSQ